MAFMETVRFRRTTLAEFSRQYLSEKPLAIRDLEPKLETSNLCGDSGNLENNVAVHVVMGMLKMRPMPAD